MIHRNFNKHEDGKMRLTNSQRLQNIEREVTVLKDTIKLLHNMLKKQRNLIKEYIAGEIAAENSSQSNEGNGRPEQKIYTFVCQKRFEKLENDINKVMKKAEQNQITHRAG